MGKHSGLETLGFLFYAVSPNRTSFETPEEIPDYIVEVVPFFVLLIVLEKCIAVYKKKSSLRVNDAIGSLSQGMLQELARVSMKGVQFAAYFYVYYNWRIVTLPWNSMWTWWLCFVGVDFAYYWLHRASHEINFLWASHQVHHSSEDYNFSTALRQSVVQPYSVWMFYLPMALAIPPSVYLVHNQFNTLYQFWIHTEYIRSLGPLEYIFNTASHHRVHHGRNRYCIDKNYGGTLIIWDRIFGTFAPEDEPVVYGLTHPINSFQPLYIQMAHFMHIWRTFWDTQGFGNKLSAWIKGPGWMPGKPWHGNIEDIPDVKGPVQKYDPQIPGWCKFYVAFHFFLLGTCHIEITEQCKSFSQVLLFGAIIYEVLTLTTIGMLLEGRLYAPWLELLRCLSFFLLDYYFIPATRLFTFVHSSFLLAFLRMTFVISSLMWAWYGLKSVTIILHPKKVD